MPTADEMLSAAAVTELARCLGEAAPELDLSALRAAPRELAGMSFSERGRFVRDAVLAGLPEPYPAFEAVVRTALGDPRFTGWMIWPVTEAVAARALPAHFDAGLDLLAELTPLLTAEFAVRSFLDADLDRALAKALTWTRHENEHVRRLASEGTRPRLPWARQVKAITRRPDAALPVLDALHRDDSEYVRRSVANHLNDISRLDPELCVRTASRWLAGGAEPRLVRHGLRTLVKQGDPAALELLGFGPPAGLAVDGPRVRAGEVAVGEHLTFDFTLLNQGTEPLTLAIDYVVHHRKANGALAPKVFKLTTRTLPAGEAATIERRHSFKPISTRVYHPGEHALELQINGQAFGRLPFLLTTQVS
ncbi:DNA alkylation repair protein [Amycolatopsis albispora]|uniref:DNA alkylation repair protein n=1 Tax=Amycolatopsis albispora TaxID=1804986 RepID=A0A344L1Y9_9PSEU|nr:DNA alkylation repair protein [Amycolatopsis albispora]AXB42063.1 DNA alkylation repair protein [Amycolatopsis albispora]